jgi:MFS transporter, DHA1 family, tetracycline resistance protein
VRLNTECHLLAEFDPPVSSEFFKNKALFLLFFTIFLDWIGLGLISPIISSIFFDTHSSILSESTCPGARGVLFGLALTLTSLTEACFAPILGVCSDLYGRKKILLICLSAAIVGYLLMALSLFYKSIFLYFFSRFIFSIYSSSSGVYSASIADLSCGKKKPMNFCLYSLLSGVGFTIAPFIGGMIAEHLIWLPFVSASLLVICNAAIITTSFSLPSLGSTPRKPEKALLKQEIKDMLSYTFSFGTSWKWVSLALFFSGLGWSLYAEFAPASLIIAHQFTTSDLGSISTYESFFYMIGCLGLLKCSFSKNLQEAFFLLSMFFLAILVAVLYLNNSPTMLWFCLPLQQCCLAIYHVTSALWISDEAKNAQGTALGMQASLQSLAFTIAPLLGALFLSQNVYVPRLIGAACLFLGALFFAFYLFRTRKSMHVTYPLSPSLENL